MSEFNPNQAFKGHQYSVPGSTGDQNPGQFLKSREEFINPFTIQFGDAFRFVGQNRDAELLVISDVRQGIDVNSWIVTRDEETGNYVIPPMSGSSQVVHQLVGAIEDHWSVEQIKTAMGNYKPQNPVEAKIIARNVAKVDVLAAKEPHSRIVTVGDIQSSMSLNESQAMQNSIREFGSRKRKINE